jgi:hypothetical protein
VIPRWNMVVLNFCLAIIIGQLAGEFIKTAIENHYQPGAGAYPTIQDANPINQSPAPAYFTPESGDIAVEPPVVPQERTESQIPSTVPEQRQIVTTGIRRVAVYYLDVTAYTRWSDNKPGYERKYANDDLTTMPLVERRLQEWHYTVALDYAMDDMHRALITLPDGQVTHKYRFHVPGYNPGEKVEDNQLADPKYYRGDLMWLNGRYFSVPRDRFHHHGRMDVLFTGCQQHATDEAVNWGVKLIPVEVWEIVVEGQP